MTHSLVTGATGFVGRHLVRALHARGDSVRALVRATSDLRPLDGISVELTEGDLTDPASLAEAVKGQALVFHCAGAVGDWGAAERFHTVNVEGTRCLIEAMERSPGGRLIHLSSLTVLGIPQGGARVDEQSPYTPHPGHPYVASKIGAEQVIQERWERVPATIVRPAAIWGPGDPVFFPRWARLAQRGWTFNIGRGRNRVGMVHVDNLVQALILASESPAAVGQLFHITDGEDPTSGDLFAALASALEYPPPRFGVPVGLLRAAASAAQVGARALRLRRPPALTPYAVKLLSCDGRYDIAKARRELGYNPALDLAAGVKALAQWYRASEEDRRDR